MEKKSRKGIIIGIAGLLLVTLTLLGLTYAYYRTRIVGNQNDTSVSVTSDKLEVVYSDNNATFIASGIEPGYSNESDPKTFTVENTGNSNLKYSIKLDNLDNEFNRLDWTYELLQEDTKIEEGVIPNGASEVYIANSIEIDANTTQTFKLIIRYANPNEDQSEDMGKNLSFRINIDDETGNTFTTYATEGTLLASIANDNDLAVGKTADLTKYKETAGTSSSKNLNTTAQGWYIAYADSYKFNEWEGTFDLVNPQVAKYSEVYTSLEGKYVLTTSTSSSSTSTSLKKTGGTSVYKITSATTNTTSTFSYDTITKTTILTAAVLQSSEDDYGTSYYFRGEVENNYVNYSGMCWRIVRVQGDGTIKLTLADENGKCNATTYSKDNTTTAFINGGQFYYGFNTYYQGSDIASALTTWITDKNLDTTYLETTKWCNDTSVAEATYWDENAEQIDGSDPSKIAYSEDTYGANTGFKCTGGTIVTSNIATLTAPEVRLAGIYLKTNAIGLNYWTMSPAFFNGFEYYESYYVSGGIVDRTHLAIEDVAVRPVIALKSTTPLDSSITGQNGTQTNPYVIS